MFSLPRPTPEPFLTKPSTSPTSLQTLPLFECETLPCDACFGATPSCAWCADKSTCVRATEAQSCGRVASSCAVTIKTIGLVESATTIAVGGSKVTVTMRGGEKSELTNVGVGVRPSSPVQWLFSAPVAIVGMVLVAFEPGEVARLNASANARQRSSVDDELPSLDVHDSVSVFSNFQGGFYVYTLEALEQAAFDVASIDVESARANELPIASPTSTATNQPILIDNRETGDDGSMGLTIGLIVGGVLLLLLIGALVIFFVMRQRRRQQHAASNDASASGISEPPTLPRMPTAAGTDIYGTFPANDPDPVTATASVLIPPQYDSVASLRHSNSRSPSHTYGKAPVAPSSRYDAIDTPL